MQKRFNVLAALMGNLLEWYDFTLYGVFATIIAATFFNATDMTSALMQTFAVFAVGYFMRPIGGIILAHFADTRSASKILLFTYALMGLVTLGIGLLPSYQQLGWWASFWLVLLRLLQGFAVGGEFPGSMIMLRKFAHPQFPALTLSLAVVSAMGGLLLGFAIAALFAHIMSPHYLASTGWRYAFLLGFVLAIVGIILRRRWLTSVATQPNTRVPLLFLWQQYKRHIFIAVLLVAQTAVFTALTSVFLEVYWVRYLHLEFAHAMLLSLLAIFIQMLCLPLGAYLNDRYRNHVKWAKFSTVITLLSVYPLFYFMQHYITLAAILLIVIYSLSICSSAYLIIELFPPAVRYSGVALTHGVTMSLIVGLTPLVMNSLLLKFGLLSPAVVLIIVSVLNLIALIRYPDKKLT
jgi:MFS family permease